MQEHGCFSTGWTFRPVWMKQARLCTAGQAQHGTVGFRFGNADASMAQPGSVELAMSGWRLSSVVLAASGVSPAPRHLNPYGIWITEE